MLSQSDDQFRPPAGDAALLSSLSPRGAGSLSLEDFIEDGPLLFPPSPPAPRLSEGTVEEAGAAGEPCECDLDGERVLAKAAPSCLLAPQAGDRVLVCRTAAASYVLAVLERTGPATLALPDTARIEGGRLTLASDTLRVVNNETTVRAARLNLKGILARADFTFLTLKAREFVRLAANFLSRSKAAREEAEEAMRISAPDLRMDASETLRARAGTLDLKAEGAAKMDGSTVQLG
ncbi:MAG: DUF3540 domain-containing protein [Deltaproteobacteria bacterium]|jgi:hypothetical protein|nr:DUF3540 domain-containing protein [Deltaproteobacteria bacterium]